MPRKKDILGLKFNSLTAVRDTGSLDKRNNALWEFLCDCGNTTVKPVGRVKAGTAKSCGCLVGKANIRHGKSGTYLYSCYMSIKARCYNKSNENYKHYGDRGITMCDRWLESFENFYEDMGDRPYDDYSLERIDVNKGYSKCNCIWASPETQARNHRKCVRNTSGFTGVFLEEKRQRYCAAWIDIEGNRQRNYFSINKYGKEEAFSLACEVRENAIKELNEQGAGYSENHGK